MRILLFLLSFSLLLVACRPIPKDGTDTRDTGGETKERGLDEPNNKQESSTEPTQKVKDGSTQEPEKLTYAEEESLEFEELSQSPRAKCWVGGLIVKAYPGETMPKVATLETGEEVEYLYQRTARKAQYTFKGQKFSDSWYLIRTASGVVGWVHGGGIKFLPNSPESVVRVEGQNNQRVEGKEISDPSLAQQANDWVFVPGKRVGSIHAKVSEDQLVKLFGPDYVKRGEIVTTGG